MIEMLEEEKKAMIKKIGLVAWVMMQGSIRKAYETNGKVYHVTDNKKILGNKKYIEKRIPNLMIMKPEEWLPYVRTKLNKKDKEEFDKKIIEKGIRL